MICKRYTLDRTGNVLTLRDEHGHIVMSIADAGFLDLIEEAEECIMDKNIQAADEGLDRLEGLIESVPPWPREPDYFDPTDKLPEDDWREDR